MRMTREEKEQTGKYVLQMARLLEDGCYQQEMLLKAVRIIDEALEQEPKTGHWKRFGNSWEDKFKCSECGKEQPKILCCERIIGHWSDYCPNCGAKMEG